MDKGIAKSWQYFTPEQIGIPYWRVREIQNIVGTYEDAKIGRDTILQMCRYIERVEKIARQQRMGKQRWAY